MQPLCIYLEQGGGYRSDAAYTVSYILNKLSKFLQNGVGIGVGVQKILKKIFRKWDRMTRLSEPNPRIV